MRRGMLLIVIAVSGCGVEREPAGMAFVDVELLPYVERFEKEFEASVKTITVELGVLDTSLSGPNKKVIGVCYGNALVRLDELYWEILNDPSREALMYHELGHCYYGLDHVSEKFSDGCPKSIMNPSLPYEPCYIMHRQEMLDQFRSMR